MKGPSTKIKAKKQEWKAVSCIILLYTLSWPKWKPAAHLVACKISYRRGIKITHTHTRMHNFVFLSVSIFWTWNTYFLFTWFSITKCTKKCAIQHQQLWFALVGMHRNSVLDWEWAWSYVWACVWVYLFHTFVVGVGWFLFLFYFVHFINSPLCKNCEYDTILLHSMHFVGVLIIWKTKNYKHDG